MRDGCCCFGEMSSMSDSVGVGLSMVVEDVKLGLLVAGSDIQMK